MAYQSAEAFDAWVAGFTVEPLSAMPHAVQADPRYSSLLAPFDAGGAA